MRVWKYTLGVKMGLQSLSVPGAEESKVVAMRMGVNTINVWIEMHPEAARGTLEFQVFATGDEVTLTPDRQTVHHTTVFDDRFFSLVWHVYQLHKVGA